MAAGQGNDQLSGRRSRPPVISCALQSPHLLHKLLRLRYEAVKTEAKSERTSLKSLHGANWILAGRLTSHRRLLRGPRDVGRVRQVLSVPAAS